MYQSRWGFHPCDWGTLQEIKELHRYALRDLCATRRRERWLAKRPENRNRRDRDGTRAPVPEPKALGTDGRSYAWILAEY